MTLKPAVGTLVVTSYCVLTVGAYLSQHHRADGSEELLKCRETIARQLAVVDAARAYLPGVPVEHQGSDYRNLYNAVIALDALDERKE